ncbi:4Fe-4S cluster-binding domain-containing protein, partial [Muribaculaceae bacterium Isolate-104 (HZI)]
MLRVSSYIIFVDLDDDSVMLLHGYAGSIDIVPRSVADLLRSRESVSCSDFDSELFEGLANRRYLTKLSQEEENDYFRRMAVALHKKDMLLYASYTFVVTYDCNFRCPYCFERELVKGTHKRHAMTKEMVDKAFSAIMEIQKSKQRESKHITLFGGEPLLKENLELVEYIVAKGAEAGFTFSAITNGYDLDAFVHLLAPDRIRSLQITIDGTEDMHNQKRLHKDDVPTFKKIVDNIGMAIDKDIAITIRFNTDRNNFSQLKELKAYFDELGYTKHKKFAIDSARLEN